MYEMNNTPKFQRNNSQICPSTEDELFSAVLDNDINRVRRLVLGNPRLLSHIYSPEYNKPILLIACQNAKVEAKTVKTLLDLGANPKEYDEVDGYEAIHLAAQKTDPNTLKVLLDKNPNDINSLTKGTPGGSNALHILIRYSDQPNSEEFIRCAEILISNGINVNQGDANFVSPILWAAKKGQKDLIKLILQRGGPVDLDSHKMRGQTARDIILQKKLYDGDLSEPYVNNNLDDKQRLFAFLKQRDEESFVNYRKEDDNFKFEDIVDEDDTNLTLLQTACDKGLVKAVRHLIEKGADPNKMCKTEEPAQLPIVIAANHGFSEIFGILLDQTEPPSTVLHSLLRSTDDQYHDIKGCYDLLMKRIKKRWENGNRNDVTAMLNDRDGSGNTPLHYAVRYAHKEIIQDLLDMGASLGSKNKFDYMPVEDIDPEVLEEYLDGCVKFDLSKKIEREDFEVTFDYRSLIPPYLTKSKARFKNKFDMEAAKLDDGYENQLVAETEVIYFMSNSPDYRHLLTHPVIVSFLFMKWKKVQWIFQMNLLFYITFSLSLVAYIFADYLYPVGEEKSSGLEVFGKVAYTLLLVGFFILILRETFQLIIAPINYFKGFENYIEIFLILLTGIILFQDLESKKQVAAMAILLAVFESMLMLGPHPYFSTRVEMLKTVSLNFFKFLIWYVWLILAFALSFYILYSPSGAWSKKSEASDTNKTLEDSNKEEEEKSNEFFETPGKSVFKTVIMLTGEFDSGDLDFQTFPVTSALIFSLFIFMIAIILLNLLNGLAVSDTQMIKNESELIGHIVRAHYVRHIERMLEGNVIPVNTLEKLRTICCCFPRAKHWNCKIGGKVISNAAYLFPHYLNYELTFYPDKFGLIRLPRNQYRSCRTCNTCSLTCLDKETVKRTNGIIQARKEGKSKVEKELKLIKEQLNGILEFLKQGQS